MSIRLTRYASGLLSGGRRSTMGREFIGECRGRGDDPESDDLETELAIKYIKQSCGPPPPSVDVQVIFEGFEVGNEGDEAIYPVISVVWDDCTVEYPGEY